MHPAAVAGYVAGVLADRAGDGRLAEVSVTSAGHVLLRFEGHRSEALLKVDILLPPPEEPRED